MSLQAPTIVVADQRNDMLATALRANDRAAMTHAESRGLELAVGLALPATLGLIALSQPIVRTLFEHGRFTAADTEETARALMWLALGLPAHVLVKALSPAFFAREDTMTPLWAALQGTVVAIVAGFVLGRLFGAGGIAAAIACGAWSSALSLIRHGAASFGFSIDPEARRRLPRIVLAALAMGGLLWPAAYFATSVSGNWQGIALVLLLLIAGGMIVYGLALAVLGVTGWQQTLDAIRPAPPDDLRA